MILPQFCNFEAVTANLSLPVFFLSEIGEENTVGIQNKSVIARNIIALKKDHCYKLLKYFSFISAVNPNLHCALCGLFDL